MTSVFNLSLTIADAAVVALLIGCRPSTDDVFDAVMRGRPDQVEQLLEAGADPNVRRSLSVDGHEFVDATALHVAAYIGNREAVDLLLAYDATIDAGDAMMRTPLHIAAWRRQAHILPALLEAGAAVDRRDAGGITPLFIAAFRPEDLAVIAGMGRADWVPPPMLAEDDLRRDTIEILLRHNADPIGFEFVAFATVLLPDSEAMLALAYVEDVNQPTLHGASLLYLAVMAERVELVRYLVSRGADVDKTGDGSSLLDIATNDEIKSILRSAGGTE